MGLLPTPADIQYMQEHIRESKVRGVVAVNVSGLCITTVAVCLRLISRRLASTRIGSDDLMIVVALAGHPVLLQHQWVLTPA